MCDEYQQDGVGLGLFLKVVNLPNKCDRSFNFNWTLQVLMKQLYYSCRNEVVSALKVNYLLKVYYYFMTVATTTLTGLNEDVHLPTGKV